LANIIEAALLAKRMAAADILSQADQQGMVFLEKFAISGKTVHEKGLIGSVAIGLGSQTDTVNDATGISIDNKDWLIGTIQYYRIGGLLANTMDGKQLLAEVINLSSKQLIKVVFIAVSKPVSQGLKL